MNAAPHVVNGTFPELATVTSGTNVSYTSSGGKSSFSSQPLTRITVAMG